MAHPALPHSLSLLTQRATTAPELAPTHPTCQVHMNEKREAPRDGSGDTNCASLKMNAKLGPAMPVCDARRPPHDSLRYEPSQPSPTVSKLYRLLF